MKKIVSLIVTVCLLAATIPTYVISAEDNILADNSINLNDVHFSLNGESNFNYRAIMNDDNWKAFCYVMDRWYGYDIDFNNYFQLCYEFVIQQLCFSHYNYVEQDPKNILNYYVNGDTIDNILKLNFNLSQDQINSLHSDIYYNDYGAVGYYNDNNYYCTYPEGTLQGSLYLIDVLEQKNNFYKIKFVNNDYSSYGVDDSSLRDMYYCIFEVVRDVNGQYFKIHKISDEDIAFPGAVKDDSTTSFGSQVSEWAKEEVEEAYNEDLVPEVLIGKDLTQKVDRAEFAAIAVTLYENLSKKKATKGKNPFVDIYGNACEDEILKAYNLEITIGTSDMTFEPDINITREQVATMLTRAYKKSEFEGWSIAEDNNYPLNFMGVPKFDDDAEISDYAKESVYFMTRWNIIQGVGNNKFAPKNSASLGEAYGYATREQALVIALRSKKHL